MPTITSAEKLNVIFNAQNQNQAVIDHLNKIQFTYSQLEDLSSRLALMLSKLTKPNQKIAFLLPNGYEIVLCYLACLQAGITSIPINPDFHEDEINVLLDIANPHLVIGHTSIISQLKHDHASEVLYWDGLDSDLKLEKIKQMPRISNIPFENLLDNQLVHIVFSSGSTGQPKAIPILAHRIIGHAAMFAKQHKFGATNKFYSLLPLAYLGGWYNLTLVPFMSGGTIIIDKAFGGGDIYTFWDRVKEYHINCLWVTPSILTSLLMIYQSGRSEGLQIAKQIQWAMVGMAPLDMPTKLSFEQTFQIKLQQSYGLSETFLFTSWCNNKFVPNQSVGTVLPGYTVKISPDGEIHVKSLYIFDGYLGINNANSSSIIDKSGFLKTGDLGYFDHDKNLYITGRIKDIIIRGGVNISPAEIECVLSKIDGVVASAVIGVPDKIYGEKIVAFVQWTNNLSSQDIRRECAKRLSAHKIPDVIRQILKIPLNTSGKINKQQLQELYSNT